MSTGSVEVVYRGIFQKTLAKNICRGIVLAARKDGKIGIAFGRYGDSPERNGIPAKQFAVVSDNNEELEEHLVHRCRQVIHPTAPQSSATLRSSLNHPSESVH